jgi:ATP-dependent Clp protease ATP-binding subunit ClpA
VQSTFLCSLPLLPRATQFINEVRDRTGAAVQLFDEVEKAGTRVLQVCARIAQGGAGRRLG